MAAFCPELIAAVDIGSPKGENLGWATLPKSKSNPLTGTTKDIEQLISQVSHALEKGPVALGFEAPLWVPMRPNVRELTNGRKGEGTHPWSAGAGCAVLTTGLAVIPYILAKIRDKSPKAKAVMDFHNPPTEPNHLFLWEAFVSGTGKGKSDEDDATIAAKFFQKACKNLLKSQVLKPKPCFNLLGAMLLRTGWSNDLSLLESKMLVVGPAHS